MTSRVVMQAILAPYGMPHVVENGREALTAVHAALEAGDPFRLICLDIMMPELDGQEVLRRIRQLEKLAGIGVTDRAKVFMTTSLRDRANLTVAGEQECDAYLVKPINKGKFLNKVFAMGLVK